MQNHRPSFQPSGPPQVRKIHRIKKTGGRPGLLPIGRKYVSCFKRCFRRFANVSRGCRRRHFAEIKLFSGQFARAGIVASNTRFAVTDRFLEDALPFHFDKQAVPDQKNSALTNLLGFCDLRFLASRPRGRANPDITFPGGSLNRGLPEDFADPARNTPRTSQSICGIFKSAGTFSPS